MAFESIASRSSGVTRNTKDPRGLIIKLKLLPGHHSNRKVCDRPYIVATIGEELCKDARILVGDRAEILIDTQDRLGLIKRVTSGGWAVSSSTGGALGKNKGKYCRSKISIGMEAEAAKAIFGNPLKAETTFECENVVINAEGILFALPSAISKSTPCKTLT